MRDETILQEHIQGEAHYSIGEAADLLGVSVPTLRLYEKEGLVLPMRKASRHRLYSAVDLERIRCLRETINAKKVSIAGIKRMLALIPCWSIRNCPAAERDSCPAFRNAEMPCWSVTGKPGACEASECRLCPTYSEAADCSSIKRTIADLTIVPERTP
ncbi:MAG: MerR family transcriptional regulator [Bacteroidetes bacterium]|nr:MerR family transcriptional regulator [Bacteroidota bacterium]